MAQATSRTAARHKRHARIRLTVEGTAPRPRLAVFRSLNQIYAQVIDDAAGRTIAAASSLEKELRSAKDTKTERAKAGGLRPGRFPLPRARQVAGRGGPRSRPRLLAPRGATSWPGSTPRN